MFSTQYSRRPGTTDLSALPVGTPYEEHGSVGQLNPSLLGTVPATGLGVMPTSPRAGTTTGLTMPTSPRLQTTLPSEIFPSTTQPEVNPDRASAWNLPRREKYVPPTNLLIVLSDRYHLISSTPALVPTSTLAPTAAPVAWPAATPAAPVAWQIPSTTISQAVPTRTEFPTTFAPGGPRTVPLNTNLSEKEQNELIARQVEIYRNALDQSTQNPAFMTGAAAIPIMGSAVIPVSLNLFQR